MKEETDMQIVGSASVTFVVKATLLDIPALKYIRVGTKYTIKAMPGTKSLFKFKNDIVSGRALQRAADKNNITVVEIKAHKEKKA